MLLNDELVKLRTRVISEFSEAMEFKAITHLAYQMTGGVVNTPPDGRFVIGYASFAPHLGLPDKPIRLGDWGKLSPWAVVALDSLIQQHQVALFEHMFFDVIRALLVDDPRRLPAAKKVDYSVITRSSSRDEIVLSLVDRELNDIKYENVSAWFDYLKKLVSGCEVSNDDVSAIAEAKAARDLIVHNAGVVNEIYIRKAGKAARFTVGERVSFDGDYVRGNWQLFSRVLVTLIDTLSSTFESKSAGEGHE